VNWNRLLDLRPLHPPPLDARFLPASLVCRQFRARALREGAVPLRLAVERADGSISVFDTLAAAPGTPLEPANPAYAERLVKFLLWQRGGWRVWVGGPRDIGEHIRREYAPGGARAFDAEFMGGVYERPFCVEVTEPGSVPPPRETATPIGRHLEGCRVGFDLGASDRKASAVIDGVAVFSEETAWDPRHQSDPRYHYEGVMDSIRRAVAHLPRLDAVGGSAAGIYIQNRVRVASLFRGVPEEAFEAHIADMFIRIGRELGVPLEVANDGDVTALAGSMSLGDNPVLGIAMGSSQAAGYVDATGCITGWLNELAFAPVDYAEGAPVDEWSGDAGCGVQYFSQVGAVRLAQAGGMAFEPGTGLPERLVALQDRMRAGDPLAEQVYASLGCCLGYGLAHYADFYDLKHVLVLGRVTTGPGGEVMIERARQVLEAEFPDIAARIRLALPDEKSRRVGQAIAAASLPAIRRTLEGD